MCGSIPKSQSKFPPYFWGKSSGCIKDESVDLTSCFPSINILETVTGSNHRLIQPQTVGKNVGAPIICPMSAQTRIVIPSAYIYSVERLGVVCCCQYTSVLHMRFQIPELCQAYVRDIDDVGGVCDWNFRVWSFEGRAHRQDKIE